MELNSLHDFNQEVSQGIVIVDFYATWCGPCKMLAPELEDLVNENPEIKEISVDVDKFNDLAAEFNIRAVPTLVFYNNGQVKKISTGYRDKDSLLEIVNSIK